EKYLDTFPNNYCDFYCQVNYCKDGENSYETCYVSEGNFIGTATYQLSLRYRKLYFSWLAPENSTVEITPISTEKHIVLKNIFITGYNNQTDFRPGLWYLQALGIEKVENFRFEHNFFSKKNILEKNVHYLKGPQVIVFNFADSEQLKVNDYIQENLINQNEISIFFESVAQKPQVDAIIFETQINLKFLSITGFYIENLSSETFRQLNNLKTLILSDVTINNMTFLSSKMLQENLEHLELDFEADVSLINFENFQRLKLIKVQQDNFHNNSSAILCTPAQCKFSKGDNGVACPNFCDCQFIYENLELEINCSERGFSTIPPLPTISIGRSSLLFGNNLLTQLPNRSLSGYLHLKKLDVAKNMLTKLNTENLPNRLDYLDIRNNRIASLDAELIGYIEKIEIFKQSGNLWLVQCENSNLLHLFRNMKDVIRLKMDESEAIIQNLYRNFSATKLILKSWNANAESVQEYIVAHENNIKSFMYQQLDLMGKRNDVNEDIDRLNWGLSLVNDEYEFFVHGNTVCPHKCECCHNHNTNKLKIICTHALLHTIPKLVPFNNISTNEQFEFILSENKISTITVDMLPQRFTFLDMRNNSIDTIDDQVVDLFINNSAEVRLLGNPLECDCQSRSLLAFLRDNDPMAYTLALDRCNIALEDCADACICCRDNSSISTSFVVDCRYSGLVSLPVTLNEIAYCDMRNNSLAVFSQEEQAFIMQRSLKLLLSGNPWSCTCQDLDSLNFMKNISANIEDFSEIYCSDGNKLMLVEEMNLCPSTVAYFVALGISIAALTIAINVGFCFRKPLQIWFYEQDVCLSIATRLELDQDKKYDAFLAFTHKDEALVEEFVERLENGNPSFKLCFYLRDWMVGESIPECISRSVKESRRIIILMTDHFLQSTWGRLEFRLALHATSHDRCKRLIVVLYPDVKNFDALDSELKAYMVLNTYLERSHTNFWNKLIYAMPHAKHLN
ncbi:hypothetical protein KR018_008195, partial [Drosophila ironensis]